MQQPKWIHGSMRGRSGSWWLSGVGVVFGVVATQTADQDNPSALSIPPFHRHGGNMLGDWAADPIPGKRSGRGRV